MSDRARGPGERLARLFESHEVTVRLDGGTWRRLLAYIERNNHDRRTPDDCKLDPESPEDLGVAIYGLVDAGLEAAEHEAGLAGSLWGDMYSREQVEELRKRKPWHLRRLIERAERRDRGEPT